MHVCMSSSLSLTVVFCCHFLRKAGADEKQRKVVLCIEMSFTAPSADPFSHSSDVNARVPDDAADRIQGSLLSAASPFMLRQKKRPNLAHNSPVQVHVLHSLSPGSTIGNTEFNVPGGGGLDGGLCGSGAARFEVASSSVISVPDSCPRPPSLSDFEWVSQERYRALRS